MNARQPDGCTLREQLLSVQRQTKKTPVELQNLTELPESCYSIWGHFLALDSKRSSNGYGANPLSYSDIKAYFDLIQETVEPCEVRLINTLDRTLLDVYAKQAEKEMKSAKK